MPKRKETGHVLGIVIEIGGVVNQQVRIGVVAYILLEEVFNEVVDVDVGQRVVIIKTEGVAS